MKKFLRKHLLAEVLCLIFLVTIVICGATLKNNKAFMNISRFSKPYCSSCLKAFEGEVCSKCEASIVDTGMFTHIDVENSVVSFSDYYTSYENYISDMKTIQPIAYLLLMNIIGVVLVIFIDFAYHR